MHFPPISRIESTLICADPTRLTDKLAPALGTSAKIRVALDLRKSAGGKVR
jgi:hypothetical protein